MSKEKDESFLPDQGRSDTAATVGNKLYGESGVMTYRVTVQHGAGLSAVDVDAATGDEAAATALGKFLGGKVLHVEPAPQKQAA